MSMVLGWLWAACILKLRAVFLCCWRVCLVCLALELVGPCVVLGFSVGMEAFDELLSWCNAFWECLYLNVIWRVILNVCSLQGLWQSWLQIDDQNFVLNFKENQLGRVAIVKSNYHSDRDNKLFSPYILIMEIWRWSNTINSKH